MYEPTKKEKRLVPEKGVALPEDTPLNFVFINGTEFDILNCTVQDIVKEGGVVHVEVLENGRFINKDAWQHQYDEEYEVASHYEVKAVSYGRYAKAGSFVQFCSGILVGMDKDEIDKGLGKGGMR